MNDFLTPTVSVILSVHNGEKHLKKSIESIVFQTYKNLEIIIIDDGSSDFSIKIIKSFNDNRIKIIRNSTNIGLPASLNKGIKRATGYYIARQDDDDISNIFRIEKQLKLALSNDSDAVFCRYQYIDRKDRAVKIKSKFYHSNEILPALLAKKDPLAHGSAMIKKSVLLDIGGYDENFIYSQDYELWVRMLKLNYKISMIKDVCYFHRIKFDYNKKQHQKMYASLVDTGLYQVGKKSAIKASDMRGKRANNLNMVSCIINFWNLTKFTIRVYLNNSK